MIASDRRVRQVFVELGDPVVADFDVVEFLDRLASRCQELLDVSACGLLLVDHDGNLNLVAASSEHARLLELLQLQGLEGPCLDTYRSGTPTYGTDLSARTSRWPRFAP